jgi:hypothetical protein
LVGYGTMTIRLDSRCCVGTATAAELGMAGSAHIERVLDRPARSMIE